MRKMMVLFVLVFLAGCASMQSNRGDEQVYQHQQLVAHAQIENKLAAVKAAGARGTDVSIVPSSEPVVPVSSATVPTDVITNGDATDGPYVVFSNETGQDIAVTIQSSSAHPLAWTFDLERDELVVVTPDSMIFLSPTLGMHEIPALQPFIYDKGYSLTWRQRNSSRNLESPTLFDVRPNAVTYVKRLALPKDTQPTGDAVAIIGWEPIVVAGKPYVNINLQINGGVRIMQRGW